MNSNVTSKKFPTSKEQWDAAFAAAPGTEREPTAAETAQWANSVVIRGGGYQPVGATLAAKRRQGERGAQLSPTKQLVSVRYSPEVLDFFKASGSGWQTRMDEALKQWVASHQHSA